MSQLNIQINGRAYSIACDDGQEEHLKKLSKFYGDRVEELAGAMGHVGESRLMLMAGLMVADELSDANAEVTALQQEVAALKKQVSQAAQADQEDAETIVEILSSLTGRLDGLASRLEETA